VKRLESVLRNSYRIELPNYLYIFKYKELFNQSIDKIGRVLYYVNVTKDKSYRYHKRDPPAIVYPGVYNDCVTSAFRNNALIISRETGYDRTPPTACSDDFPRRVSIKLHRDVARKKDQFFKINENVVI
jgi:hypothetical protein